MSKGLRGKCHTDENSVQNPSTPCILPFKINGIVYDKCLPEETGKYWCPTRVKNDREFVFGQKDWGYCSSSCPPLNNETIITSTSEGTKFSTSEEAWKGKILKKVS